MSDKDAKDGWHGWLVRMVGKDSLSTFRIQNFLFPEIFNNMHIFAPSSSGIKNFLPMRGIMFSTYLPAIRDI
jgi:hypothetical protein